MAAEKAADLLLGPVVNITITKVIEQLDLVMGFKQELESFRDTLTLDMVWGFLRDAEQKGVKDRPDLKRWLERLWSIAEEADDVMDEIAYENLRRKVAAQKQMLKQVSNFFTPSNPIAFRRKMAKKIKKLNAALDDLNTKATGLGLQRKLENMSPKPTGIRQTDSLLGEPSDVVGRDGDLKKIVKLLIDSSNQQALNVVSIVGLPGLGKTTLAKLVCNNDQVQGHFFKIMWVCVSENFDVERILLQMLESLNKGSCGNITSRDVVVQSIKEKLEEKSFLLVLDDVWNENRQEWEGLRSCLSGISKKNGSSVLVTTRIQNVASVMGALPAHVHYLEQLEDDECWSIIRRRVFGNSPIPLELETIGSENAKKCKGVPLVASVVGGILCNNTSKEFWCEVWGSVKENDGVSSVLKMSFNRLPEPALKQCFAFCSIFPKDFVMEKEILIQLWMAHGFLSCERQKEMEDVGDKYFNDFLSYSLFQDAEKDCYGRVTCKMHDLIHDLAQSVSEPQTLILGNGSRSNITADTRHLNLISDESMAATEIGDAMRKLHTLFSKIDIFHSMPANFKKVRVLNFSGANIDKLPTLLRKLKHLRYLDVSETEIKELPEFITKLYQLQTLRFMYCECIERPLEGIGNLVNLRHIYFNDEKQMPAGVGTLTCLQTLPLFVVGQQQGRQIEELGGLSQLKGELVISNLKVVRSKDEAKRAKLLEKTAIQELTLEFDEESPESECRSDERRKHDEDVLEGLQPHSNLKSLTITNYCGEKCPSWMLEDHGNLGESTFLKSLVSLSFYDCPQLQSIPSLLLSNLVRLTIRCLDELESISSLSLSSGAEVQIRFCKNLKSIADSYLQELVISSCDELVSIEFGPLVMTSLKKIQIVECGKLESLPMFSGIGESLSASTCLKELYIRGCNSLELVPSLDGLSSLQKIDIIRCGKLKSIGESLSASTCLKELYICDCDSLELVPSLDGLSSLQHFHIWSCGKLKSIEGSLLASTFLKELSICFCNSLELVPNLDGLSSLQKIDISCCEKLKSIGESLSASTCLTELYIRRCDSLELVSSLDGLSSLQKFNIWTCEKLKSIGESLSASTYLKELSIISCDSLQSVASLHGISSVRSLTISTCGKLTSLPSGLPSCIALEVLEISNCHNLISIQEDLWDLRSLVELKIVKCGKLRNISGVREILGSPLARLKVLQFGGFSAEQEELEEYPIQLEELDLVAWEKLKHLPDQIQRLTALRKLRIDDFDGLEALPDWLGNLSSLQYLGIFNCKSLKHMEAIRRLSNLDTLEISGCPELSERCARESGSEWNNISHVPTIGTDTKPIGFYRRSAQFNTKRMPLHVKFK